MYLNVLLERGFVQLAVEHNAMLFVSSVRGKVSATN